MSRTHCHETPGPPACDESALATNLGVVLIACAVLTQPRSFAVRMPLGAQLDSYPLAILCLPLLMVPARAGIARMLVTTR